MTDFFEWLILYITYFSYLYKSKSTVNFAARRCKDIGWDAEGVKTIRAVGGIARGIDQFIGSPLTQLGWVDNAKQLRTNYKFSPNSQVATFPDLNTIFLNYTYIYIHVHIWKPIPVLSMPQSGKQITNTWVSKQLRERWWADWSYNRSILSYVCHLDGTSRSSWASPFSLHLNKAIS